VNSIKSTYLLGITLQLLRGEYFCGSIKSGVPKGSASLGEERERGEGRGADVWLVGSLAVSRSFL